MSGRAAAPRPEAGRALPAVAAAAALLVPAAALAMGARAPIALMAVAIAAVLVARAPEMLIAAFLAAGAVKSTPLAQSVPVDLTLVTAGGLVAAIALSLWRRRAEPLRLPPASAAFAALCALMLLATLWSPAADRGVGKAATFVTLSALAFASPLVMVRDRAGVRRVAAGLVVVGVAIALSATATGHSARPLTLPGGDSEIDVGLLAGLGVVAVLAYLIPTARGAARLLWLVPAAVIVPVLMGAGSRGALLATACAVAVALLVQAVWRPERRALSLALVVLLVVALPVAWGGSSPAARERYLVTTRALADQGPVAALDAAGGDRVQIMGRALDLFTGHPLGVGTHGYTAHTGIEWPHNVLLELGSELGVAGLALFVLLVAGAVGALGRALRAPSRAAEGVLAAALLAAALVVSMSSFDLNGNRVLWFALGLALAVGGTAAGAAARRRAPAVPGPHAGRSPRVPRPVLRRRRPAAALRRPSVMAGGVEGFLVRVLEAGLALVLVVMTARLLGPEGRGLFALASLTATVCSLILGSVWSSMAIELARGRETLRALLGAALVLAVAGGIVTALVAGALAPLLGENWWVVALPAAATPGVLAARYSEGLYQTIGHVRAVNLVTIGRAALPLLAVVGAFAAGLGEAGVVAAWALGLAMLGVLSVPGLIRLAGRPHVPRDRRLYARLVSRGLRLVIPNSSLMFSTRLALVVLAVVATTSAVGVYSVAIAAAEVLYIATNSLVAAAFHRVGSGDEAEAAVLAARTARHTMVLCALGGVLLVPVLVVALPLLVGDGYAQVPLLVALLIPGTVGLSVFLSLETYVALQRDRPGVVVRAAAAGLCVNAVLATALALAAGAAGAAVAASVSNLLIAVLIARHFLADSGASWRVLRPGRGEVDDHRRMIRAAAARAGVVSRHGARAGAGRGFPGRWDG